MGLIVSWLDCTSRCIEEEKMRKLAILAFAVIGGTASAQVIYNNADGRGSFEPIGLGTENRPAGGYWSRLQTGHGTFGYTANTSFRLADDFTVSGPSWNVNSIRVYAYQTGATAPNITGGNLEIRAGGATPGAVLFTGTFNAASNAFTNVYRETTTSTLSNRQVQIADFDFSSVNLGPGSYWIAFDFTTAAGTPFVPNLTNPGVPQPPGSNNAMQLTVSTGVWAPILNGPDTQDLPFSISGTIVPEPATMAVLGLGAAALLRRRRKN
jgi:hypothetical protein